MNDPKNPEPGERSVDVTDLDLVDITPEQAQRLLKLRDDHPGAIKCVLLADPAVRKQAGLSEVEVQELGQRWTKVNRIEQVLPAARKLVELLEATDLAEGAEIAMRLGEMAHQVRRRASKMPAGDAVLAVFQDLLDYQYGPAQKIADRRAKAKAAAEAQQAATPPVVTPPAVTPPAVVTPVAATPA